MTGRASAALASASRTPSGVSRDRSLDIPVPSYSFSHMSDIMFIGSGHFGITVRATLSRCDGLIHTVACKVAKMPPDDEEWSELIVLSKIPPHPHVVGLLGYCPDWGPRWDTALLFEYHPGGTLEEVVQAKYAADEPHSPQELYKIAFVMACSVLHIHANGVLHRDIAPRNFVLDKHGLPILIDFGLSRANLEYTSTSNTPLPWRQMPLESVDSLRLSCPRSDIYSLGISFWQLYHGCKIPFPHIKNYQELLKEFKFARERTPHASAPLSFSDGTPAHMESLIRRMCSVERTLRPSAREVCRELSQRVPREMHDLIPNVSNKSTFSSVLASQVDSDSYSRFPAVSITAPADNGEGEYVPFPKPLPKSHSSSILEELSISWHEEKKECSLTRTQTQRLSALSEDHTEDRSGMHKQLQPPTGTTSNHQNLMGKDDDVSCDEEHDYTLTPKGMELQELLKPIEFRDLIAVVRTLRENDVSVEILEHLTDEQLSEMFSAPGTFIRMKKHVEKLRSVNSRNNRTSTVTFFNTLRYRVRGLRSKRNGLHYAVCEGVLSVVRHMLNTSGRLNINSRAELNRTPLHLAAFHGHAHIVAFLLKQDDVDFNALTHNGKTAFSVALAAGHHDVASLIVNDKRANSMMLHDAITYGRQGLVEVLLRNAGIDLNSHDRFGATPLINSIRHGHRKISHVLLNDQRVDASRGDLHGQARPLHYASTVGHDVTVRLLLERDGVNVNLPNQKGHPAIELAMIHWRFPVACILIRSGRIHSDDLERVLWAAAKLNRRDILDLVLRDERVNLNSRTPEKRTALDLALKHENFEFAERLLECPRVDPSKSRASVLRRAVRSGRIRVVKLLLQNGRIDTTTYKVSGDTVLCVALQEGSLHIAGQLLSSANAHVAEALCTATRTGGSPRLVRCIHDAAARGDVKFFRFVFRHDLLNVNAVGARGDTILHVLARNFGRHRSSSHEEILRVVLSERSLDVNARNELGETALHIAANTTRREAVAMVMNLLRRDDLDVGVARTPVGRLALHDAAAIGNVGVVSLLLSDARVDVNAMSLSPGPRGGGRRDTALGLALQYRNEEVAVRLLEDERVRIGTDFVFDCNGNTALHLAAKMGSMRVVDALLLRHRAPHIDVNALNRNNESALVIALMRRHSSNSASCGVAMRLLRDRRVDATTTDGDGNTALHLAARLGHEAARVVEALIEDGSVDINAQNSNGETALHVALRSYQGDKLAERMLRSARRGWICS